MMKKLGFTLAEVLITLGIIGVVAALTAPALVQNTGSAQIGPKLAKAVSTFETANQNLLTEANMDTLIAAGAFDGAETRTESYLNKLANYMKISIYDESNKDESSQYRNLVKSYDGEKSLVDTLEVIRTIRIALVGQGLNNHIFGLSKDGCLYIIGTSIADDDGPAHRRYAGAVLIDINGYAKPNRLGKDAFLFTLYADGSLRPFGSNEWYISNNTNEEVNWETGTTDKCNEEEVTSGISCAGSIFENNLKVIYQ